MGISVIGYAQMLFDVFGYNCVGGLRVGRYAEQNIVSVSGLICFFKFGDLGWDIVFKAPYLLFDTLLCSLGYPLCRVRILCFENCKLVRSRPGRTVDRRLGVIVFRYVVDVTEDVKLDGLKRFAENSAA